jgi:hypothetical protein
MGCGGSPAVPRLEVGTGGPVDMVLGRAYVKVLYSLGGGTARRRVP